MSYTLVPSELIVDGAITSAKLDTNISISGTLGVTGEVTLATHLNMGDNDKIKIGAGGDLEIYHDGSNSYIANSTGNIYIADTNGAVHIQAKLNEESIVATADGAVTLYHDNSAKLATASGGVTITGTLTADDLEIDSGTLSVDASNNRVGIGTTSPDELLVVDGDAKIKSTNKLHFTNTSDQVFIHAPASNTLALSTNNTERMRIDSSGNLSLGTTSHVNLSGATVEFTIGTTGDTANDGGGISFAHNTSTLNGYLLGQKQSLSLATFSTTPILFLTNNTERMRIDSSGELFLNTTSAMDNCFVSLQDHSNGEAFLGLSAKDDNNVGIRFGVGTDRKWVNFRDTSNNLIWYSNAAGAERMRILSSGVVAIGKTAYDNDNIGVVLASTNSSIFTTQSVTPVSINRKGTDGDLISFTNDQAGCGSISCSGTTTAYNTSSDYRLKENVETMQNGLVRLNKLNPVKFTWKETGKESEGFIAHEVSEIFADCVSGEKDGEKMQGLDYGRITPLLVKAIQEQQTIIEDLKSRIETLEG